MHNKFYNASNYKNYKVLSDASAILQISPIIILKPSAIVSNTNDQTPAVNDSDLCVRFKDKVEVVCCDHISN